MGVVGQKHLPLRIKATDGDVWSLKELHKRSGPFVIRVYGIVFSLACIQFKNSGKGLCMLVFPLCLVSSLSYFSLSLFLLHDIRQWVHSNQTVSKLKHSLQEFTAPAQVEGIQRVQRDDRGDGRQRGPSPSLHLKCVEWRCHIHGGPEQCALQNISENLKP